MFNIKDYLTTETVATGGLNINPELTVKIMVDEEKIKEDIKLFKTILEQLEEIIGPYTIKVNSKKTKIKQRKRND